MHRILENIQYFSFFHNISGIHNNHVICHLCNDAQVMRDQHDGHIHFLFQLAHLIQNLCLNRYIQRSRRLICDQQLRITYQSHCNHDTLTHTTGKLVRIAFHDFFRSRNTNQFYHFQSFCSCFFFCCICMEKNTFHDLMSDFEYRIQRSHRLLEDHCNIFSVDMLHFALAQLQ